MEEIILNDNNKIVVTKKRWKNKDRIEICKFFKKDKNWLPTKNFINQEIKTMIKIINAVNKITKE